jgi:CTP:molybdopterin cytidylyltransferase MocA
MADQNPVPSKGAESARPGTVLISVEKGEGRSLVRLDLLAMGRDHVLLVHGGEVHAGAVALAAGTQCHLAVIPPHKEGPLAEECARAVTEASGKHCAVVCGIHQDAITPAEISAILTHVRAGLAELIDTAFSGERRADNW